MFRRISTVCFLVLCGLAASWVNAQTFPSRPVTVVVPFPAGGTPDVFARIIAEKVSKNWGNAVVVEVKPGAGGAIGTAYVAKSKPDGYTLLLATLSHVTNPSLTNNANYDPVEDFTGVAELATAPVVAVVPKALPVTTLKEFVEYVRQRPGEVNYLMPGIGTSMHLNAEMLKRSAGIDLVAVPYKGLPSGMADLVAGRLSFAMSTMSQADPQLRNGGLKALAVASPKRIRQLPNTPTLTEAGFPDAQVISWYTVVAPAETPRAVVEQLNKEFNKALSDPEVRERLETAGAIVSDPVKPEEVDALLKVETRRWSKFFKEVGITKQ